MLRLFEAQPTDVVLALQLSEQGDPIECVVLVWFDEATKDDEG